MDAPAVITLPLSTFEGMTMELAWRIQDLVDQIWTICDELKEIKAKLAVDTHPKPTPIFDPLQTIGKY